MFRPTTLLLLAFAAAGCGGGRATAPDAVNHAPTIKSVAASPPEAAIGDLVTLVVEASDPDGDPLTYRWSCLLGDVYGTGTRAVYSTSGCCAGPGEVLVFVSDGRGGEARGSVVVNLR